MSARSLLTRWLRPACAICATTPGAPQVCAACAADFLAADTPRCRCCGIAVPARVARCARCLRDAPHFDETIALADYRAPIDGLIVALKFAHRLDLAAVLGGLLARRAAGSGLAPTALAPVPLAAERLTERGFNQALEIGRAAAAVLGWPLEPRLLVRVRHAVAQESLDLAQRRRNVRGAFAVRGDVRGRAVTVIDDVMSSGATLDEVAAALKAAGATRVANLVVARTP
jgi:ComF family protein